MFLNDLKRGEVPDSSQTVTNQYQMQALRNVGPEKAFETTAKIYLCTTLLLQKHLRELEASPYAYNSKVMVNRADIKSM